MKMPQQLSLHKSLTFSLLITEIFPAQLSAHNFLFDKKRI